MSNNLPLKYRPQTLDEMIGNESAIESIKNIMARELKDIPSSWLFVGPAGCGKTSLARILKKELECDDMCFFEYNSSNTRGIDTIRAIQEAARLAPMVGKTKVYLCDESHAWTKEAQNAALKMLEDAPKNTFFILATTNPEKLIKPIHSRCVKIQVNQVSQKKIVPFLKNIADKEGVDIPSAVLTKIATICDGTPRDALKMLDTIIDMEDEKEMLEVLHEVIPDEAGLFEFCKMLLDKKTQWKDIAAWLKATPDDPESIRRGILGILNAFLLNDGSVHTAMVIECFLSNYYDSGKAGLTISCLQTRNLEE